MSNDSTITGIILNKSVLNLDKGNSEQLIATIISDTTQEETITWDSSDNSIATVDSNGNVTAIDIGNCTISASVESFTASCETNVGIYPTSISLNYSEIIHVINATDYNDIQELLCASDIGITDYSSWMCDYVLTRKPGFLYASDIQKYIDDERGFYYPLSSTPFKVAENSDELVKKIMEFDDKKYQKEVDKFLKDRGCYEDGNASSRIVDILNKLSEE